MERGAAVAPQGADGWPRTVEVAAEAALRAAERSEASLVLFSPACASFDRYPNFEARALAFREAVQTLAGQSRLDRTN